MPRLPKPLILSSAVVALVLTAAAIETARFAGAFRTPDYGFAGHCRSVPLAGSSADIQVDRERGIAYLSLLDRSSMNRGGEQTTEPALGTVMLLDLNLAEPAPRAAMSHDPRDFRPQGMSLYQRAGTPARLFAISGPAGGYTVEIAEQDPHGMFVPRKTVRDVAFTSPQAVAAAGPEQFYVVNDVTRRGAWRDRLRLLTRRGDGTLVYHDGARSRVLVDDLAGPAGLALSPDGAHLYVGDAWARELRIYRTGQGADGALTLERTIALDSAPANLDVGADGMVWIAAHPDLFAFLAHLRDGERRSPTQVLRLDPRAADAPAQVYADDGAAISAGSAAAAWRDGFLIGAALDKKVLICKTHP